MMVIKIDTNWSFGALEMVSISNKCNNNVKNINVLCNKMYFVSRVKIWNGLSGLVLWNVPDKNKNYLIKYAPNTYFYNYLAGAYLF